MTDAALITTCTDVVQVNYSHFYLQDGGESWLDGTGTHPEPEPPAGDDLVTTGTDWVAVASNADYHLAGVSLEAWGREPDHRGGWEISADFGTSFTTGNLALVAVMLGPSEEELRVAPGAYQGRVYSRGRKDARAALETADEIPERTEQYLIQLWPA